MRRPMRQRPDIKSSLLLSFKKEGPSFSEEKEAKRLLFLAPGGANPSTG
jgi:hypothetical protein